MTEILTAGALDFFFLSCSLKHWEDLEKQSLQAYGCVSTLRGDPRLLARISCPGECRQGLPTLSLPSWS